MSQVDDHSADAATTPDGGESVDSAEAPIDGRRARSLRTRTSILDTILDLMAEQGRLPTGDEVAERSGTSVRSLFRHFSTLEDLREAAFARHFEQLAPHFDALPEAGSVDERVDALVAQRMGLFEAAAPVWRVAANEAIVGPDDERLAAGRAFIRDQIERLFASEFKGLANDHRQAVVDAIMVSTSFETWTLVRERLDRTDEQTAAVIRRLVHATVTSIG